MNVAAVAEVADVRRGYVDRSARHDQAHGQVGRREKLGEQVQALAAVAGRSEQEHRFVIGQLQLDTQALALCVRRR